MYSRLPPAQLTGAAAAIGTRRLSNYRRFFNAQNDLEVLGVYSWNESVSSLLYRLISITEVALRNRFHLILSQSYGAIGGLGSKDWYNHLNLNPYSKGKIFKITHRKRNGNWLPLVPQPTPDDVIAKLTFGFWPQLLDIATNQQGHRVNWGQLIPKAFPGHRQKTEQYWKKLAHQDALFARMDLVNELRNRIAHHEPIWKAGPLMEETRSRPNKRNLTIVQAAPRTEAEVLSRLNLHYDRTLELLSWCSPDLAAAYETSLSHSQFKLTASAAGLKFYKYEISSRGDIDLSSFRRLSKLKKAIKKLRKNGKDARILSGGMSIGFLTFRT